MNSNMIKGRWNQLKGKIKEEYADLTDNELMETEGKAEKIAGLMQAKYGKTKEEAISKAKELADSVDYDENALDDDGISSFKYDENDDNTGEMTDKV